MRNENILHCSLLVDSGCEEILISKSFADCLQLRTEPSIWQAEVWDRSLVPMEYSLDDIHINIGKATIRTVPATVRENIKV